MSDDHLQDPMRAEPRILSPEPPRTPEEREQAEWEADRLVELYRRVIADAPGGPSQTDARLLEWRARELRAEPHSPHDLSPEAMARFVARIRERAAALRLGLDHRREVPPARTVREPAPANQLIEELRAHGAPDVDLAVAAGAGRDLWDVECESVILLPDEVPQGRYVAVRVAGDSMEPVLHAGDTVLVKLGRDVARDTVIVARVPDGGYVVKRVGRLTRRSIELRSLNATYPPVEIARDPRLVAGTVIMCWCSHEEPRE